MSGRRLRAPAGSLSQVELSAKVRAFARNYGACEVGINTVESLEGGPPSTDLSYLLEGARSAVTFAMALDAEAIDDYLGKKSRERHQINLSRTGTLATGLAAQLASYLQQFGFESIGIAANEIYREDAEVSASESLPDLSHRLLAVRCGVGWFGFSGNVLTPSAGANVVLCSMVTKAELEATDPLPPQDNYCDECQSCNSACPSGFFRFGKKEKTTVRLGGIEFRYSKRRSYRRCNFVCAGYTGLHPSGRWSTWSPGRLTIPRRDEELRRASLEAVAKWHRRPDLPGHSLEQPLMYGLLRKEVPFTCGNCNLVCAASRSERDRRLERLRNSGVVIQKSDGSVAAVSPEEAQHYIDDLDPQTRALYVNSENGAEEGANYLTELRARNEKKSSG